MGRFYSTNNPQSVDFAYQPPLELMQKAVANADAQNDRVFDTANLLNDSLLKVQFLEKDRGRVQQKQEEYKKQINDLTSQIQKDPLAWRKSSSAIRDVGRNFYQDMFTGELSGVQKNYEKYNKFISDHQKAVQEGKINAEYFNKAKEKFLNDFQGTNYDKQTGRYNEFKYDNLVNTPDINAEALRLSNDIKANFSKRVFDTVNGRWINSNEEGTKFVTDDEVAELVASGLMGNTNITSSIKQGANIGFYKNALDEKGEIIKPYTKDENGKIIWNENSPLTGAVRSRTLSQSFTETGTSNKKEVNPYELQNDRQAFEEAMIRLKAELENSSDDKNTQPFDAFSNLLGLINTRKPSLSGEATVNNDYSKTNRGMPVSSIDADLKSIILAGIPDESIDVSVPTINGRVEKFKRYPEYYIKQDPNNPNNLAIFGEDGSRKGTASKDLTNAAYNLKYRGLKRDVQNALVNQASGSNANSYSTTPMNNGKIDASKMKAGHKYILPDGRKILFNSDADYQIIE